jgi:hypothetical protein
MCTNQANKPRPRRLLEGVPPETRVVIADVTWEFYETFVDSLRIIPTPTSRSRSVFRDQRSTVPESTRRSRFRSSGGSTKTGLVYQ